MREFDHFIYGGRELEPMRRAFALLAGAESALGGRHPGLGTHNALVSLGEGLYLELLAVDPTQTPDGVMASKLQGFDEPHLFAYMLRGSDLEAAQAVLERHGIASDLFDASRTTPDGAVLRWRLLVPRDDNPWGDFVPKFIDWLDTPHPSRMPGQGYRLESFSIGHPRARELGELLQALAAPLSVQSSDRPYLQLKIGTPGGSLVLAGW